MEKKLEDLKARLYEIYDFDRINSLLSWDQSTYMPVGGAKARARQTARMTRLMYEKATDPEIGRLLDDLRSYEESLPYDSDDASLIRVSRREYERVIRVPPAFMAEFFEHAALSYQVWTEARPANDFNQVRPYLEKTLDYSRRLADFFPGYKHIADPLIDFADYGMKASSIQSIFSKLREQLVPIVQAIISQDKIDDSCLRKDYPGDLQIKFGETVIKKLGYDFNRGRQDLTHHPFTTSFAIDDVRITTRIKTDYLNDALFSTIHEAGHAMYELGINPELEGTPLASGTSAGVHESQSRLWENRVGRSHEFWEYFYPELQKIFPSQLANVDLETFYQAINNVQRSLIRVDADEVTYNLHVMLRFDLELAMLEGSMPVRDLPEAWHARFESDFGITPPDDRHGVLQDVHWYGGSVGGAFQGYTLGNILGAQFFETALKAHPDIPAQMREGNFDTLHGWLKENIYQHGSKFTADELIQRVTGGPLSIDPYIQYLKNKYGQLYKL